MAFLSGLGIYVGHLIDARLGTSPLLLLIGLVIPLGLGVYRLIHKLESPDKTDDDDPPTHPP